MNLYLNGVEDFSIVREDTLAHPAFVDGSHLRKFDIVLANPPYSIKTWNREAFMNDKWGRNFLGTPPQGRADYAFFQHILASMDDKTGRCAILFPHGVLFRKEESEIRQNLVKNDLVECIIGIGRNLFYNSCMDACVVICRKNKPNNRKNKILFIDAKGEVTRKNADSYLEPHHIEKIVSAYQSYISQEGFCSVVENKKVLNNNAKMSVALYVKNNSFANEESIDPEEAIEEWNSQSDSLNCELDRLFNYFVN
jgi:type I restriction enzyme M protein